MPKAMKIQGARVHNLKNISVDVPLNKIMAIAGVSGSGKSFLALGVVYTKGSRRDLITWNRPFLRPQEDSWSAPGAGNGFMGRQRKNFPLTARAPKLLGISLDEACKMTLSGLADWVKDVGPSLPDVDIPCPQCRGLRYGREAWQSVTLRGTRHIPFQT